MVEKKKVRAGCGRCGSEDIDVTKKAVGMSTETCYVCLKCGFGWCAYVRGGG